MLKFRFRYYLTQKQLNQGPFPGGTQSVSEKQKQICKQMIANTLGNCSNRMPAIRELKLSYSHSLLLCVLKLCHILLEFPLFSQHPTSSLLVSIKFRIKVSSLFPPWKTAMVSRDILPGFFLVADLEPKDGHSG